MHRLSIATAHEQILGGRLRPTELVGECLAQIRRLEPQLRAWVLVDDAAAIEQAQAVERALRRGEPPGTLAGIPIGIKDIVDVAGWPTRAGSPLTSDRPAALDAPSVARLRAAGAVILGKTVTTEFACFDPPPTRNPWNLAHTPGGSSSGSAAAVAASMCLGAIGTQTGGSIVRPAAYCGVCGLKPSFDAVPRAGVIPVSEQLDHVGPIAGSIADVRVLWRVLADEQAHGDTPAHDADAPIAAPRLAVLEDFLEQADAEVASVARAAIEQIARAGARLTSVRLPPDFGQIYAHHRTIMAYEAAQFHRTAYGAPREGYGPNLAGLLAEGFAISAERYTAAREHLEHVRASFFAEHLVDADAWLMPSTNTLAPGLETTGDPRFNSPWSYLGAPEVTFPCGLATGLPVGLQLVAPAGADDRLLAITAWCEAAGGWIGTRITELGS